MCKKEVYLNNLHFQSQEAQIPGGERERKKKMAIKQHGNAINVKDMWKITYNTKKEWKTQSCSWGKMFEGRRAFDLMFQKWTGANLITYKWEKRGCIGGYYRRGRRVVRSIPTDLMTWAKPTEPRKNILETTGNSPNGGEAVCNSGH